MSHTAVDSDPSGAAGLGRARTGLLLGTVFFSGAAVMVVEMTAVRALQPFFGSTTWVWTNVIAVVLAALAAGYAIGGRLADRWPSPFLLYCLLSAGGVLVAASALLATPVSELFLADGLDLAALVSLLVKGSLGATLILFAPATLLLGMISPLAIRLLSAGGVGKAAGRVFAVSTVGSILGTYLPVVLLVPRFGSRGALLAAAGLLLVPGAVGLVVFSRARGRAGAVALALLAGIAAGAAGTGGEIRAAPNLPDYGSSTVLAEAESPYQYLSVREDTLPDGRVERLLTINEALVAYHSLRVQGRVLSGYGYHDGYSTLPMLLDLAPGDELRCLVLGLACGVNAAQWRHFWGGLYRLRVDGAEIDPEVIDLGRRFFDLPEPGSDWLRVFPVDGRQLLRASPELYHLIVVDAFTNELYVPFHLATREFFELCRRRLAPGGIVAMNVYAKDVSSGNLRAIENTLATVFGAGLRVRHPEGEGFLLLAWQGGGLLDVARLAWRRTTRRFGGREEVAEWNDLLEIAASIPTVANPFGPREGERILTDDHAPLEWLTDRFLDAAERRESGR